MQKRYKIIIDTNLWISFLITHNFARFDALLMSDKITLLFDKILLDEIVTVAHRQKYRKYFSLAAMKQLYVLLRKIAVFIDVETSINCCRDEKDDFLLALAKAGSADYLLTGDDDLLVLKKFGNTQILTLTEFEAKIKTL